VSFTSELPCKVLRTDLSSSCKPFACCFHPVFVWVSVVYRQGLFLWYNLGSDLLMLGRPRTAWNKCTAVRSPYIRGQLTYKREFKEGSVSFSESFDPDDPALIDRYPDYTTETDLGDRPPTPTQKRDGSIASLFVSMLLICRELVRRCVVARFV
jgi:hypothetical protein